MSANGGAKRYQASFCGYFPADNPKYSMYRGYCRAKRCKCTTGVQLRVRFLGVSPIKFMQLISNRLKDSIPPYNEVPQVKPGLKEDIMLLTRDLGFKNSGTEYDCRTCGHYQRFDDRVYQAV